VVIIQYHLELTHSISYGPLQTLSRVVTVVTTVVAADQQIYSPVDAEASADNHQQQLGQTELTDRHKLADPHQSNHCK